VDESFLYFNSSFEKKYARLLAGRYITMKIALNLFIQRDGKTIVETGTTRNSDNFFGDGCSTIVFGEFCEKFNKKLVTIDINKDSIELAKKETQLYSEHITYIVSDSIEYLKNFEGKIDLLYLDSMDCLACAETDNPELIKSQEHNLKELLTAMKNLSPKSIILLDDNGFINGGKPKKKQTVSN